LGKLLDFFLYHSFLVSQLVYIVRLLFHHLISVFEAGKPLVVCDHCYASVVTPPPIIYAQIYSMSALQYLLPIHEALLAGRCVPQRDDRKPQPTPFPELTVFHSDSRPLPRPEIRTHTTCATRLHSAFPLAPRPTPTPSIKTPQPLST
jgi:hypothetical protein